jgi:hypothetical protein
MDIATSLVTASDIQKTAKEMCVVTLSGQFNPEHLPKELQSEHDNIEKQLSYHLGQIAHLYQTRMPQHNDKVRSWFESMYYHHPNELIGNPGWENFYPAIVLEDRPYSTFAEAVPATEANQRYLATQLLRGNLTKKEQEQLLRKAQNLVCALDPHNKDFFCEMTLNECLEQEGLGTNKTINNFLNRKEYIPVTKADKRYALAQLWEDRDAEKRLSWQFAQGAWDEFESEALVAFTYNVMKAVTESTCGYHSSDFEIAIWDILREADERGVIKEYYLDPRDEDTWLGLANFGNSLRQADNDAMHNDYQQGKYTAQVWMRGVGLPTLYNGKADWWAEMPNVIKETNGNNDPWELLAIKANKSPREQVKVFKSMFHDRLNDSKAIKAHVFLIYEQRLKEVLAGA